MLDNGAAEKTTHQLSDLVVAARMLGAHEIVLPDVMYDPDETIKQALFAAPWTDNEFRYMGVATGRTIQAAIWCIEQYATMPYVKTIGIPRLLNDDHRAGRYWLMDAIGNRDDLLERFEFHMLGASAWMRECVMLSEFPYVRGLDTSSPIKMGLMGKSIRTDDYKYDHSPMTYFNHPLPPEPLRRCIDVNVRTYLDWSQAA